MPAGEIFNEARRIVTWHYQWMVLHDFVERITETGIVAKILDQGRRFYRFKKMPYMPVEFSAAAYRFGHSMVREVYSHNRIFTPGGGIPATLDLLFKFTGLSGGIIGDLAPDPPCSRRCRSRCFPATGSSTGDVTTSSLAANPARCAAQSLAQDRSVPHAATARSAGRRRQPRRSAT